MKNRYHWTGLTLQGKKTCGDIFASNLQIAKITVQNQGILIIKIQKKWNWTFSFRKKISQTALAAFFRQLSTLISAGIPIVQCCEILTHNHEHSALQTILHTLKTEIESGKNLTSGLRQFPNYFDELTCQLINAGEYSGTLNIMLQQLAHYKEKSLMLRRNIKQALLYPCIVLIVSLLVSLVMLICVIPRFEDLFQNVHQHLPALTLFVISISNFLRHQAWILLIPFIISILLFLFQKQSLFLKSFINKIVINIPLIRKIILARFARCLATLFAAGIPITQALEMTATLYTNQIVTHAILQLHTKITTGSQLHVAMSQETLFPKLLVQMIKIGEESGSFETMLEKTAEFYEADIDYWVHNMSHLIEPLIIIILGVLIGGMVIAMYLPIFKLGTVI